MSRLGIFVFYDPDGIVDGYVTHLLQTLRPNFKKLIVVSNSNVSDAEKNKLEQNSDGVFVRENRGLDAAAFKAGMVSFCGWEEVCRYDEVVLINDTFFGPMGSFVAVFDDMAEKDLDFWGMSAGYESLDGWGVVKYGYIPNHIQTFFVAFRKQMVQSTVFQKYWNEYDDSMDDFISVVSNHEMIMTRYFQDHGFRWDIYADTECYHSDVRAENINLYLYHSYRLLKDHQFPVLKKKVLCENLTDYLYFGDLEEPAKALSHIQNHTNYDMNLIWDHVLRLYHTSDLYHTLHLNYVLPSVPKAVPPEKRAALIYHISNPVFIEDICAHAAEMADAVDVYIIPGTKEIQRQAQAFVNCGKVRMLDSPDQKAEMGAFVLCCKDLAEQYDYTSYLHDLRNEDHAPVTAPESTVSGFLQNMANDRDYLSQVIHCFETNPRLGVLGTPFPVHHHGFSAFGNGWDQWYAATEKLAEELGLRCQLSEKKQPFLLTGAFWCRKEAIAGLWHKNWRQKDFAFDRLLNQSPENEALKRLLPYLAQSNGYYSGIVMHTDYASMRLADQQFMLDQIIGVTKAKLCCNADCFSGYMHNLQALGDNAEGTGMMIDVSQFGVKTIIRIWMDRHMPKRVTDAVRSLYSWLKRLISR